ncbi:roadblock/LC7 domain-containing protein [Actinacidiphila rubida]|uniref:Predicted regulator of Ras-like GTPase activity, Roadblock/LC7/MglB family n=1 Tax=Actinacidiphila rubida TaxID=310780 RepID=A0A1H8NJV6_9ACTN|nr:roadblock/LC7 domain-containing protein [Actinacidiphila rubida]SEO29894.1 Predicted regulator of Ras-like GTPase activity, Roadblock/LC7/MglB family [Actinacidiphila rubida]
MTATAQRFSPRRSDLDWLLEDFVDKVPGARLVVLLTVDGLAIAQSQGDKETVERIAAVGTGFNMLGKAVANLYADGVVNSVGVDVGVTGPSTAGARGGFVTFMAAGEGTYLALVADKGVDADPAFMNRSMVELRVSLKEHLGTDLRSADHRTAGGS